MNDGNSLRFCVAPMMDWTDRHCRFFHRILTRRARLYTEMLTSAAILRGDRARLLHFHAAEHPLAVQDGGSRHHLGVEQRAARQQAVEGAAVPVRPVHHGRDAEFVGWDLQKTVLRGSGVG